MMQVRVHVCLQHRSYPQFFFVIPFWLVKSQRASIAAAEPCNADDAAARACGEEVDEETYGATPWLRKSKGWMKRKRGCQADEEDGKVAVDADVEEEEEEKEDEAQEEQPRERGDGANSTPAAHATPDEGTAGAGGGADGGDGWFVFELGEHTLHVHPASGRVCAMEPEGAVVGEFDPEAGEIALFAEDAEAVVRPPRAAARGRRRGCRHLQLAEGGAARRSSGGAGDPAGGGCSCGQARAARAREERPRGLPAARGRRR
ncbi:unnamed protein product [Prorocentrum cordatum]|uniref:Uncharacterized protein n=1 Tax=Prorocentrum cordatum TaxID=2364126 RepID=A0ABN9TB80_9DINO|nr:unnamed protein product [Polarella glacialis]